MQQHFGRKTEREVARRLRREAKLRKRQEQKDDPESIAGRQDAEAAITKPLLRTPQRTFKVRR